MYCSQNWPANWKQKNEAWLACNSDGYFFCRRFRRPPPPRHASQTGWAGSRSRPERKSGAKRNDEGRQGEGTPARLWAKLNSRSGAEANNQISGWLAGRWRLNGGGRLDVALLCMGFVSLIIAATQTESGRSESGYLKPKTMTACIAPKAMEPAELPKGKAANTMLYSIKCNCICCFGLAWVFVGKGSRLSTFSSCPKMKLAAKNCFMAEEDIWCSQVR